MIVLKSKLNNIFGFDDFEFCFSYPKKIINSLIEEEHLRERPNFRYKKAVILMGSNATGKTSFGKALLRIFNYINTENKALLLEMVPSDSVGSFSVDFVNEGFILHRLSGEINSINGEVDLHYASAEIDEKDSYEKCSDKLTDQTDILVKKSLKEIIGEINFRFAYPEIESSLKIKGMDKTILLKTLKAVIGTLDPTLTDVSIAKDLKDSFIIRRKGTEIIIQEGKLLNRDMLSSGTAEGIDIAVFLASMIAGNESFYYCDEHFSYIQSDIEKRIFGIMLDNLGANEQMIFTTHNTDMLDLNLPKHTYAFLRKKEESGAFKTTVMYASDILKRNTDSIRCAVQNDVFSSLPDESLLDTLERGWTDEE